MTSDRSALTELRQDIERLVSDLFESDSRGTIPPLEIDCRDGQLAICARLPGAGPDDADIAVEVRLALGRQTAAAQSTPPREAASASITAPPAAVRATAA
jgi:HSP20 family molecular chaperone IbpA